MGKGIKISNRGYIGNYRHAVPYPKDNLYRRIRIEMRLTQSRAAAIFGMSASSWRYRERQKRMYHLAELVELQQGSGISMIDFMKLVKECA